MLKHIKQVGIRVVAKYVLFSGVFLLFMAACGYVVLREVSPKSDDNNTLYNASIEATSLDHINRSEKKNSEAPAERPSQLLHDTKLALPKILEPNELEQRAGANALQLQSDNSSPKSVNNLQSTQTPKAVDNYTGHSSKKSDRHHEHWSHHNHHGWSNNDLSKSIRGRTGTIHQQIIDQWLSLNHR